MHIYIRLVIAPINAKVSAIAWEALNSVWPIVVYELTSALFLKDGVVLAAVEVKVRLGQNSEVLLRMYLGQSTSTVNLHVLLWANVWELYSKVYKMVDRRLTPMEPRRGPHIEILGGLNSKAVVEGDLYIMNKTITTVIFVTVLNKQLMGCNARQAWTHMGMGMRMSRRKRPGMSGSPCMIRGWECPGGNVRECPDPHAGLGMGMSRRKRPGMSESPCRITRLHYLSIELYWLGKHWLIFNVALDYASTDIWKKN